MSGLVAAQAKFLADAARLILWCQERGWVVTGGELHRTVEQQQAHVRAGRSKTMQSLHLQRLAIDLNIFVDGRLTYERSVLAPAGLFWESLDPLNSWGGNGVKFVDTPHFSRGTGRPEFRRVT